MKHIGNVNFNSTSRGKGERSILHNQYLLNVSKLMNKDLSQNKVGNYFNIGDGKTLVKLYKSLDFGIKFERKLRTYKARLAV